MNTTPGSGNNVAASAALLVVVVGVSVLLRTATDVSTPVRFGISLISGIVAAAVVFSLTGRRRRP